LVAIIIHIHLTLIVVFFSFVGPTARRELAAWCYGRY
jgi:hypothetical protein